MRERFWQVREAALPSLYGLRGTAQPLAFVEDVGVPPELLPRLPAPRSGSAAAPRDDGVVPGPRRHRPGPHAAVPRSARPGGRRRLWALADEVYDLVLDLGGTISAQHGTGLARTPWVGRQSGPLFPVFRDFKAIFDPRHLFNPGKIVGRAAGARSAAAPLRPSACSSSAAPAAEERTEGEDGRPLPTAGRANGLGAAAALAPGEIARRSVMQLQRLRPLPHRDAGTAHVPDLPGHARRGRHAAGQGQPDAAPAPARTPTRGCCPPTRCAPWPTCASIARCAPRECPAHVNIPKLMLEAKAANVAEHGLDRTDWVLARTEIFAGWAAPSLRWSTPLLGQPVAPLAAGKAVRPLAPAPAAGLRHAEFPAPGRRRGWTRKPRSARPRVAYFVDIFANYNDPLIAEAVVAVLHHNGIEVYVPPGQGGCGMAPLAYGDVETAREAVQQNLRVLADLAREGYPILCSEPTAALMLRHDALDLLDDPDARLVAGADGRVHRVSVGPAPAGQCCAPISGRCRFAVGHHVPCHLKALGRPPAGPALLALIPELRVHTIDVSCSGMAGTFGLKAENYEASLAAGRPMLEELARPHVLFGSTECSTCRMQMEDAAGDRTLHPAQYLALAYGYLPELRSACLQPIRPSEGCDDCPRPSVRPRSRPRRRRSYPHRVAGGATVADLRRRLAADYPALAALLEHSAMAVENEFAADSRVLPPDAEIVLLPPVSGGHAEQTI